MSLIFLEAFIIGIFLAASYDRTKLASAYGEPPLRYPIIKANQTLAFSKHAPHTAHTTTTTTSESTTITTAALSTTTKSVASITTTTTTITTALSTATTFHTDVTQTSSDFGDVEIVSCDGRENWFCANFCIPVTHFCPISGKCHTSLPVYCIEEGLCRLKVEQCVTFNSATDVDPIASLSLSLSTPTASASALLSCRENEWGCGDRCIHKREFCDITGSCHTGTML